MNEELQGTLNDALVSVIESAASAKDFILAETPEVIEQLLMWKLTMSVIGTLIGIAMLVTVVKLYPIVRNEWVKGPTGKNELVVLGGLFGGVVFSVCGVAFIFNLTWLQILIAPKLYLLEYAADLVK